jgi:hypothetical protein
LHLHAADIGGNADMVGDENDKSIRIGILAIVFDGSKLFFVRAAAKKILDAAHEKYLEGCHQGGRSSAVENFGEIVFREIELEQTEIAQIGGN